MLHHSVFGLERGPLWEDPAKLTLADPPRLPPNPRVQCSDRERLEAVRAWLERDIVRVVGSTPRYVNKFMANGTRSQEFTVIGLPALRCMFNSRATNYVANQLFEDARRLWGAASLQQLVIRPAGVWTRLGVQLLLVE